MKGLVAAALVGLVMAWLGFAIAGWRGTVDVMTVVLAVGAVAGRAALRDERSTRRAVDLRPVAGAFPRYQRLSSEVQWALGDGRYFERVVAPELRRLARDVSAHRHGSQPTDDELSAGPLADVWQLLSARSRPRDRDEPVTEAELDTILSRIEQL